jgi:hypothetical protein
MFDHRLYDAVRTEYGADSAFPRVYHKTRPEMDVWRWLQEEEEENSSRGRTTANNNEEEEKRETWFNKPAPTKGAKTKKVE